ncbi:hypothetical protein AB0G02_24160 [Actinosynnema sp. NPDC023658]|uniref:hypothetical protein n=1 Tax=Actinosynnema sp. NPDC023658 TaxID=3155465 RepID=UPI00340CEF6A
MLRTDELTDTERLLLAASLALMANRAADERSARDFMVVAISAQNVDQSELGRWAALRALAGRADLNTGQEAVASLVLAVITQDRADVLRAYELADALPADDPRARWAETLRPFLLPEDDGALSEAGDAVRVGDRCTAARSLARDFLQTHRETSDPLVEAMHRTMVALSEHEVDVHQARQGLYRVLVLLRARQRYGQVPPGVKAGVDMVSDLLHVEATPESADLLTELMEALADAGLSDAVLPEQDDDLPAVEHARLAEAAASHPVWPNLRECVDGLRGRPALLLRRQRMLSSLPGSVLALYVEPPDSVAIKSIHLTPADTRVLDAFGQGSPRLIGSTATDDVERLLTSLIPAALCEALAAGQVPSLLVVPDGQLWSLPWQSAALLRSTLVSLAPSMSVYGRLQPFDGVVRSITAYVDADVPHAEVVAEALKEAAAAGVVVRDHLDPATGPSDLLVVFAHGSGSGLGFSTGPRSVLSLARMEPVHAALVAACRSVAAPPVSFPSNLPAAMLLEQVSSVIGGMWPVPTEPTARIVAGVITRLAAGERLVPALAAAREHVPDRYLDRWGLAVHGIV